MPTTLTTTELAERYRQQQGLIDIEITGATPDGPNRWRYDWRRVLPAAEALYTEDTEDPLTQASDGYSYAYNTLEVNNTGSGIEGSGDNADNALPQFAVEMKPIGVGAILPRAVLHPNAADDLEVYFSAPNNVNGECS